VKKTWMLAAMLSMGWCCALAQPSAAPPGPVPAVALPPPPPRLIPPPPAIPAASAIPSAEEEQAAVQRALQLSAGIYYPECDGYGPPSGGGDGMTKWALAMGVFALGGGNTRRVTPRFVEPYGVADCGAALADLEKYPGYWLRKVSLLRGRAIHRLEIGDTTGALKDLDAADAAAVDKDDIYYQRSLKLGADLARAYALRLAGDAAKADALAMQAWSTRPYSQEAAYAALITMGPDAPTEDIERVLRALVQYVPGAADQLFVEAFEYGRFDEAVELYPGIAPTPKLGDTPMEFRAALQLAQTNRADAEVFWARESGRFAYALAALGRSADARDALKAARDRLAAATPAQAPPAQGASVADLTKAAVRGQADLQIKTTVPPVLDSWARLVEARLAVNEGRAEEAWSSVTHAQPLASRATVDLLKAVAAKAPSHAAFADQIEQTFIRARRPSRAAELKGLFETLPETETRERLAAYGSGFSWGSSATVTENPAQGFTTVKYRGFKAPFPVLEDMALLKAADLARRAGKKGVVVLARRNINHTITKYMYGQAIRTDPAGYETQLDVMLVDPAAPPAAYQNARWRIIDADAVYAALAPVYIAPADAPNH
jgi:hypothetical protein